MAADVKVIIQQELKSLKLPQIIVLTDILIFFKKKGVWIVYTIRRICSLDQMYYSVLCYTNNTFEV
jgi:hypothetical protein